MADQNHAPQLPPRPRRPHLDPIDPIDPIDLTNRFEHILSARRMTQLASRARSRPSTPSPQYSSISRSTSTSSSAGPAVPPSYSSLRNIPKVATPPQDPASVRFRSMLTAASVTPVKYENPGLLDDALAVIPLDRIYSEADEESQLLQAQAASISDTEKPLWGYQDCVIRALVRLVSLVLAFFRSGWRLWFLIIETGGSSARS